MKGIHLVTGAAGFLGRNLVRTLAARGYRVRAFDLRRPDGAENEIEWVIGDVRDSEAVRRACAGVEVVHHLAALIPQRKATAETMRAVNVEGTRNVLEAAEAAGVRRVVYLSSVEIYGVPSVVPCPEEAPASPLGEYGRNKLTAEGLCREAVKRGLEVVILRPPTIVGPGLEEPFLVGILTAIREGRPVMLLGRSRNRFQFVHVEDVVAACLLAAEDPGAAGEDFNLGSAEVPSIYEMVREVIARVGSASAIRAIPVPAARFATSLLRLFGLSPLEPEHLAIAISDYVFDIGKVRRKLGWEPRWGNVEAVLDTYRTLSS